MEKAQEILFHIDELYTENPSEEKIIRACQENPVRYQAWVDAFKDYELSDVLQAIDQYWEYKNSKTKPNVAQIKAVLNAHKAEKLPETKPEVAVIRGDEAITRMSDDIASGNCRHNLYVYKDALSIVLNEWLKDKIPVSEWSKVTEGTRIKLAYENGLFDGFDDALKLACQRKFGRDFEFQSKNDMMN